jgi:hypothetical protein
VTPDRPPEKVAELVEWSQQQLVRTTCGLCGASVELPAPEARAWFEEHRRTEHPDGSEP